MVKNLPAMQETLDQEDLLEKGLAIHFSVLACRIPWTEEPGGLQSMGVTKSWTRPSDLTAASACKSLSLEHPL